MFAPLTAQSKRNLTLPNKNILACIDNYKDQEEQKEDDLELSFGEGSPVP